MLTRAVALSRWTGSLPSGYQRLYFGAAFCSWAMPPRKQIAAALDAAHTQRNTASSSAPPETAPVAPGGRFRPIHLDFFKG